MEKRSGLIKPITKDAQLHLRVYESEHRAIKLIAARAGLTVSEYIMELIKKDAEQKGFKL